jgi:hypothetical protein
MPLLENLNQQEANKNKLSDILNGKLNRVPVTIPEVEYNGYRGHTFGRSTPFIRSNHPFNKLEKGIREAKVHLT